MKYVIRRQEGKFARCICPECGSTLLISDGTAPIDLPEVCGSCGKDIYFMGNDFEENNDGREEA